MSDRLADRFLLTLASRLARGWRVFDPALRGALDEYASDAALSVLEAKRRVVLTAFVEVLTSDVFSGLLPPYASVEDQTDALWRAVIQRARARLLGELAEPHLWLTALEHLEDETALAAMLDAEALEEAKYLLDPLTPTEQEYVRLKLDHPDANDAEIGAMMTPPRSPDAVYQLTRRLRHRGRDGDRRQADHRHERPRRNSRGGAHPGRALGGRVVAARAAAASARRGGARGLSAPAGAGRRR